MEKIKYKILCSEKSLLCKIVYVYTYKCFSGMQATVNKHFFWDKGGL